MRYSFLNDYSEGAHPSILNALVESNMIQQTPYGDDVFSVDAKQRIRKHLGASFSGSVHFVASGTLANLVSISSVLKPYEAVITVQSGHIVSHEAGAIEATGHKLITVPGVEGKLTPANLREAIAKNSFFPHMAKPGLIYISNVTEMGTVYTHAELSALSAIAKEHGLLLFMDGARMGMALASNKNDMTLADIAKGKALDMSQAAAAARSHTIVSVAEEPEQLKDCDVVVVTDDGIFQETEIVR